MKANISSAIEAHLIRGAFYLLLLLAVRVTPFVLGQRTTGEQSTTANMAQLPVTSTNSDAGVLAIPEFPMSGVITTLKSPVTHPNHKKHINPNNPQPTYEKTNQTPR